MKISPAFFILYACVPMGFIICYLFAFRLFIVKEYDYGMVQKDDQ
jgi:hypothetical protein